MVGHALKTGKSGFGKLSTGRHKSANPSSGNTSLTVLWALHRCLKCQATESHSGKIASFTSKKLFKENSPRNIIHWDNVHLKSDL